MAYSFYINFIGIINYMVAWCKIIALNVFVNKSSTYNLLVVFFERIIKFVIDILIINIKNSLYLLQYVFVSILKFYNILSILRNRN